MDLIFEGALSKSWGMPDVLKTVTGVENMRFGILRISAHAGDLTGKLVIENGKYIVGASISGTQEKGYGAARKLLLVQSGNFALLDAGVNAPKDKDNSLFMSITEVIAKLPSLPVEASPLFDERSLLDRVFGPDQDSGNLAELAPESTPIPQESDLSRASEAPIQAWNLVQPLFSGTDELVQSEDEQKESMHRLRSLPARSGTPLELGKLSFSRHPLIWLLIVALLSALVSVAIVNLSPK